jgi:hypothetical protein
MVTEGFLAARRGMTMAVQATTEREMAAVVLTAAAEGAEETAAAAETSRRPR